MNLKKLKFWKTRVEKTVVVTGDVYNINRVFDEELDRIKKAERLEVYKIKSLNLQTKNNNEIIQSAVVKFISQ